MKDLPEAIAGMITRLESGDMGYDPQKTSQDCRTILAACYRKINELERQLAAQEEFAEDRIAAERMIRDA